MESFDLSLALIGPIKESFFPFLSILHIKPVHRSTVKIRMINITLYTARFSCKFVSPKHSFDATGNIVLR